MRVTAFPSSVTFAHHDSDGFVSDVKSAVASYFANTGKSRNANVVMLLRTFVMFSLLLGPYIAILIVDPAWPWVLAAFAVMGVAVAGIGFGVAHDALHGSYARNPRINAMLGWSFDLLGASSYMWKVTHNVVHHTYTNIHGIDEDLEVSPLLRLSPSSPRKPWHRLQHLYAPLAYSLSTLNWIFVKDFDYFSRSRIGPYRDVKHPPARIARMIALKVFALGWMLGLPLLLLSSWVSALAGFVLMQLLGGFILGIIFQLAHVVEQTAHPVPDDLGRMPNGWLIHEMLTTANFCGGNRLLTWYVGGLNHQIEHHLFPKVCSVHYPAIARLVRPIAAEHGVPYHHNSTLLGAIGSHLRTLRGLGTKVTRNTTGPA